jgi:CubicO group peptidase (beta-lactamase class C family)
LYILEIEFMKKQLLVLAFGLLFHHSYAQQENVEQLASGFDKMLSEQFKTNETGATALVARKGEIIYLKAFGMANLESDILMRTNNVFRIGSITKQFTAIAILQLMEQGKLSLQDEITKFIPDYPTQGHTITIEHLLTHTSGIQSYTEMEDFEERMTMDLSPAEVIDHFKSEPMQFAPGTKWHYNNSGYFILGYIIEKVSGITYPEYLEENIFKPVGMSHSLYGNDQRLVKYRTGGYTMRDSMYENAHPLSMTQPYAAGSIQSTVEDLFKWNQALHSYQLVTKESLDMAFTNYKLSDGTETDYGYGWNLDYIQGIPTIEHGGGINGSLTMAIYVPEADVFVAVFSNCECNSPEDIAVRMAALTLGRPYVHNEIPLTDKILQEYTGVYENDKGEQRIITLSENHLYSQRGRNRKFIIKAYEADKFYFEEALLAIEFVRNKKGKVESLITVGRDGNYVWNKTNNPVKVSVGIKVDEKILEKYLGEYEIVPEFTFVLTKEQDKIFVQATGQEKLEIEAQTETKFLSKENDAQFEFIIDESGTVTKVILIQNGRTIDAKKIR